MEGKGVSRLVDRVGDALCGRAEPGALLPAHLLQHLESHVLAGEFEVSVL